MQLVPPSRHDEILRRRLAEKASIWQGQTGIRRIIARLKVEFWSFRQAARELQVRRHNLPALECDDRVLLIFNSVMMALAALSWLFLQIPMRKLAAVPLSLAAMLGPAFLVLTLLDLIRTKRTWRLWLALGFVVLCVALTALAFYHAIVSQ